MSLDLSLGRGADLDQTANSLGTAGDDGLLTSPVIDDKHPLVSHPQLERLHTLIHPSTVAEPVLTTAYNRPIAEHRVSTRGCEVCGGASHTTLARFTRTEWPVVQCDGCGFVYLGRVPDYSALSEELAWETTFAAEKRRRTSRLLGKIDAATRWRMKLGHWIDRKRSAKTLGMTGNVLDIGCGGTCRVGPGPTPHGIEISKGLARMAEPAFAARGGRVIHAPALDGLDAFEDGFFTAILMRSYLEHEAQARAVLEKAFAKLAPGGTVYVRVPDYGSINRMIRGAQWCGWRFPDHVNYFTSVTLRRLAEEIGFKYRRINWLSPLDDNVIAELRKEEMRSREPWYARLDNWCHRNGERVQAGVCIFLGCLLTLAAYSEVVHPALTGDRYVMSLICKYEPPSSPRCPGGRPPKTGPFQ
jgi:SAM-dependent methyltransferase